MSDLPTWVLDLVYRLDRAEEEHPKLYRYAGPPGTRNAYEPVETCYLAPLLDLVPADVLNGVRFAARWQPTPDPEPEPEPEPRWKRMNWECRACKEHGL